MGKCPYCKVTLETVPKRKTKCPKCGQFIYVRSGKLMTEENASIEDWIDRLDISRKEFDQYRKEVSLNFGFTASVNDTIWRILNIRQDFWEMGRLVSMEGKDPKPYIRQEQLKILRELKSSGVKKVRVQVYGGQIDQSTCEKCKSLHGKVFDIDKAIEETPVPNLCENEDGWCRCTYIDAEPEKR